MPVRLQLLDHCLVLARTNYKQHNITQLPTEEKLRFRLPTSSATRAPNRNEFNESTLASANPQRIGKI